MVFIVFVNIFFREIPTDERQKKNPLLCQHSSWKEYKPQDGVFGPVALWKSTQVSVTTVVSSGTAGTARSGRLDLWVSKPGAQSSREAAAA